MEDTRLIWMNGKKFYIYGLGINAKRICDLKLRNNIQGLIALDNIGKKKYGFRIYSLDKALLNAKGILIAATRKNTDIIYQRIKDKVPDNIPIYNTYGVRLNGADAYRDNPYWNQTNEKLEAAIREHDVISFDCFDTLIMRKCLDPTDIFTYLEDEFIKIGCSFPIAKWRRDAENNIRKRNKYYSLDDIYDELRKKYDLDEFVVEKIKKSEIELEMKMVLSRGTIISLLKKAVKQGKKVYVLSDMYLSKFYIEQLLLKAGLNVSVPIWVSCEKKKSKNNGGLFIELKNRHPNKSILHIGDNYQADILSANLYGIDTFYVLSAKDLLDNSSISFLRKEVKNRADKILLGVMVGKLFEDPFILSESRGKYRINTIPFLVYASLTAITINYIGYIISIARRYNNPQVLFVSRDGFFLQNIYEEIRKTYSELNLPKSKYFYASRSAATSVISTDVDGIRVLLSDIWTMRECNLKRILENRFHVPMDSSLDIDVSEAKKIYGKDIIESKVIEKAKEIYNRSLLQYSAYLRYLEKEDISSKDSILLVDLVTRGTTACALSKLLHSDVHLVALGGWEIPNEYSPKLELVSMLYGSLDHFSDIRQFFPLLELAYASRENQLDSFTMDGKPIFASNTKYDSELLDDIQKALKDICLEYFALDGRPWKEGVSYNFVCACLRIIYPQYSDISKHIVKNFNLYDPLISTSKINLLENWMV